MMVRIFNVIKKDIEKKRYILNRSLLVYIRVGWPYSLIFVNPLSDERKKMF